MSDLPDARMGGRGARHVTRPFDGRSIEGRKLGGLSERARQYVLDQILSGKMAPGSIIQIGALANELGISRTPAREALISLQESSLVSAIPNQGYLVRSLSIADVRDIYLMRSVLEGATAELCAKNMSDGDISLLRESNELASRELASVAGYDSHFDERCHDFHRRIAVGAGSDRLSSSVESIFTDHQRLQSIGINPPEPSLIVEEHGLILAAISERQPALARARMEEHIATLRKWAVAMLSD
jgi:DNA-binding GntR family transcriptional regulator